MLKFIFNFSRDVRYEKNLDFELGYISVIFNNELLYDGEKGQNYMLFISISDILFGLIEYFEKDMENKEVGLADSSVTFSFIKNKYKTILEINNKFICEIETDLMIKKFLEASNEFYKAYSSRLEKAVAFDMKYAIDKAISILVI